MISSSWLNAIRRRVHGPCIRIVKGQTKFYTSRSDVPHPLWKPAAFTLVVGGAAFTLSGVYLVESAKRSLQVYRWGTDGNSLLRRFRRWLWELGPEYRFIAGVVGVNGLVMLAWRLGRLLPVLTEFFATHPRNKGLSHLTLSTFSHLELWHFGVNMLAFSSFAGGLMYVLGDKLCAAKSLAFLVTAGTFASLIGYYNMRYRSRIGSSLGASGALYAAVTLVILHNPLSDVYLIFFPFFPIKSAVALSGLIALDIVGLIRGWQVLDHASHLGGALFGVLYKLWLHKAYDSIHARSFNTWARLRRTNK